MSLSKPGLWLRVRRSSDLANRPTGGPPWRTIVGGVPWASTRFGAPGPGPSSRPGTGPPSAVVDVTSIQASCTSSMISRVMRIRLTAWICASTSSTALVATWPLNGESCEVKVPTAAAADAAAVRPRYRVCVSGSKQGVSTEALGSAALSIVGSTYSVTAVEGALAMGVEVDWGGWSRQVSVSRPSHVPRTRLSKASSRGHSTSSSSPSTAYRRSNCNIN